MSKLNQIQTFGDVKTFCIYYRPYEGAINEAFAYCHIGLGGHFIGSVEESCLLGTWTLLLEGLMNHIKLNKGKLSDPLFSGLTDMEIFELVFKSNQLEADFKPEYDYLPAQPSNELWSRHSVRLDETTDGYLILVIEVQGKLKFLWKGWRPPCPVNELDKLYSIYVDFETIELAVKDCLCYLREKYYPIKIGRQ